MKTTLDWSTRLAYAAGNLGLLALGSASGFFLMIFYTDVALVPPAIAGSALLVGKVWDVVNDPLFGYLSDRTRSRFGRRRVYLIFGALPLAACTTLLWFVPAGLSTVQAFAWIALTYALFDTAFSIVQMSHAALAADLTDDYDERTGLMAVSSVGALIGYMLGSVLMPRLVGLAATPQLGYLLGGGVCGALAGLAVATVAWRVAEPPLRGAPAPAPHGRDFLRAVLATLRNRPFLFLLSATALARLGLTLMQTSLAYHVIYRLQLGKADMAGLLSALMLGVALTIWGWKLLCDRWSKHHVYALGLGLCGLILLAEVLVPPASKGAAQLMFLGMGVCLAAHWIAPIAMLPDTMSFDAQAGQAPQAAGVYCGVYGLGDKLARTLGSVSVGWILGAFGYQPNVAQAPSALVGIDLAFGYLPAAALLLAVPVLLAYPLSREVYERRRAELAVEASPSAAT